MCSGNKVDLYQGKLNAGHSVESVSMCLARSSASAPRSSGSATESVCSAIFCSSAAERDLVQRLAGVVSVFTRSALPAFTAVAT